MPVIYLFDNDIILKLAAFDLLNEVMIVLRIDFDCLRVLDTAQFVFRGSRKVSARYSDVARERAIAFVKSCQTVIPLVGPEFDSLNQILDVGEATLIAATREMKEFVLVTGDKRCLQTFAARDEIADVKLRIQGRVMCLEQLILLFIQHSGFEMVKARVLPEREMDTAIAACFGSGELATEDHVVLALKGYIEDLRRDAPGLLADLNDLEDS